MAYYDANDDDDVIGARNIFKVLNEAEYIRGRSFDDIKAQLNQEKERGNNFLKSFHNLIIHRFSKKSNKFL